jgi:hypothetical protein
MAIIYICLLIFYLVIIFCVYKLIKTFDEKTELTELCYKIHADKLDENLNQVYIVPNVLTLEECNYIIDESEAYADLYEWKNDRHANYPTVDNDTKNIPNLKEFIENMVYNKIIPEYSKYYNIPSNIININETFVVKYSIGGQTFLEPHTDGSEFSFVLKLNDDFIGGGTYFVDINKKISTSIGSAVIFCGKNKHMGLEITQGTRYILAGFLNIENKLFCENQTENEEIENFKNLH